MLFQDIKNGRFYLGDCLEVMKEIPDGVIDMILCDLPYGTTACKWDTIIPFNLLWEQYERIIKPNGAIVLTASQPFTSALVMSNVSLFKYELIWEKSRASNFVHAKYQPLKAHENIIVFSKAAAAQGTKNPMCYYPQHSKGKPYIKGKGHQDNQHLAGGMTKSETIQGVNVTGDRTPRSVSYFSSDSDKQQRGLHPTQKPVALFEYLIKTYTNEGELVLDNCAGSGTTAIACENTNRSWVCIEKEEEYANKAVDRILNHNVQPQQILAQEPETFVIEDVAVND